MKFNDNQPIFIQIADYVGEKILSRELLTDQQIPSVRELAVQLEVNPNTVMRAFERLQSSGIVYNKRGMGNFVAPGAYEKIMEERKTKLIKEVLPGIFEEMRLLGITETELLQHYKSCIKKSSSNPQTEE